VTLNFQLKSPNDFKTVFFAEGYFDRWIESQLPTALWTSLIAPEDSVPAFVPAEEAQHEEARRIAAAATAEAEAAAAAISALVEDNLEMTSGEPDAARPGAAPPAEGRENDATMEDHSGSGDGGGGDGEVEMSPVEEPGSQPPPPRPRPALPGCRGGHQMVIDSPGQAIYLFGGWDGSRDLSDFWRYDIEFDRWVLLSTDTQADGGPPGRSCHKMVLDSR